MKLTTDQVANVKMVTGADPIEEDNPAMESLKNAFGDHTFYAGNEGLFVLESVAEAGDDAEEEAAPQGEDDHAHLVLIAAWTDDNKSALQPIQPQVTEVVVPLSEDAAKAAAEASRPNGEDPASGEED